MHRDIPEAGEVEGKAETRERERGGGVQSWDEERVIWMERYPGDHAADLGVGKSMRDMD